MSGLLNAKELAAALGISESGFHAKRKTLAPLFEVKRPVGHRRYSQALVERYKRAESMALIGAGSHGLRTGSR